MSLARWMSVQPLVTTAMGQPHGAQGGEGLGGAGEQVGAVGLVGDVFFPEVGAGVREAVVGGDPGEAGGGAVGAEEGEDGGGGLGRQAVGGAEGRGPGLGAALAFDQGVVQVDQEQRGRWWR